MAARTKTYLTDSSPGQEPVVVASYCRRVTIQERAAFGGTTGYRFYGVAAGSISATAVPDTTYFTFLQGERRQFESLEGRTFYPGQVIGFTSALAGTITMEQIEE